MFRRIRSWFNIKVIFGAIIFAGVVFTIFIVILWSGKANRTTQAPATAILNIIEAPTEHSDRSQSNSNTNDHTHINRTSPTTEWGYYHW